MFQKTAASLIIVTAASAAFFACSSDSNSSGPEDELSTTSSSSIDVLIPSSDDATSSSDVTTSSGEAPAESSSSTIGDLSSSDTPPSSSSSQAVILSSDSRKESSSSSEALPESSSATVSSSSESPYFWNDEFDTIDTTKWTFEIGTGASGWGNNEKQYYTGRSENAYVQDGILHIRANKESYEGSGYTSARMITKGKFSFTYGTVEARIALPVGKGIWPAFWMLGENIDQVSWPACGEIDIIEAVNTEHIIYGTNHWSYNGDHAQYGKNTGDYFGKIFELDITEFHTYKFTWDKKTITMFVDDFKYHEMTIEDNAGGTDAFHKPQFFLLNVAVGGNWPGFEIDDAQFPNEMLVDYIRVTK